MRLQATTVNELHQIDRYIHDGRIIRDDWGFNESEGLFQINIWLGETEAARRKPISWCFESRVIPLRRFELQIREVEHWQKILTEPAERIRSFEIADLSYHERCVKVSTHYVLTLSIYVRSLNVAIRSTEELSFSDPIRGFGFRQSDTFAKGETGET